MHLVALALQPAEVAFHAIPLLRPGVGRVGRVVTGVAFDDPALVFGAEVAERDVHRHAELLAELRHVGQRLRAGAGAPRPDRAAGQRERVVGQGERVINADDAPEALARGARADGVVEAEERGGSFAVGEVAGSAVEAVGEEMRRAECGMRNGRGLRHNTHGQLAFAEVVGLLAGFDEAGAVGGGELEAVLEDG